MIRELFLEDLSLWSCVWQSTVLAGIGLAGSFLLRRRPARAFQVLFLAMIAAVAVPAMSVLVKHFEVGVFVAEPIALQPETRGMRFAMPYEAPGAMAGPQATSEARLDAALAEGGTASIDIPWRAVLLFSWMAATLALLGRLCVAFRNGVRLIRRSQPQVREHIQQALDRAKARLGAARSLQIRASEEIRSPMIWCWSRTVVLLVPRHLNNNVDWVGVICHELAHCLRRDHISGLLAEMIACVLCWNPLSWLAKRRLVRLGEQACDDWVVAGGQPVENYARSLLNFKPQRQAAFAPAVVHSRKGVAARVRRILKENCVNPRTGAKWVITASAIALCVCVGIAIAQSRPARPQTEGERKSHPSLHRAAAVGDIERIKMLVEEGTDVNAEDERGRTPLHAATIQGRVDAILLLAARGAELDARDRQGRTALYHAASNGSCRSGSRVSVVHHLLALGADPTIADLSDETPLHRAARLGAPGSTSIMAGLIAHGADIDAKNTEGRTAAHVKASISSGADLERLIELGADLNETDKDGNTVLHLAIAHARPREKESILACNVNVNHANAKGQTPLHIACRVGTQKMVEGLIAKGARVDVKGRIGQTALHIAAVGGHMNIATMLVDQGASVNTKTKEGHTAAYLAVRSLNNMVADYLVKKGAEVSNICMASYVGDLPRVKDMIAGGMGVNIKDEQGFGPLHAAAAGGRNDVVEYLLAQGAKPEQQVRAGWTALVYAAVGNHMGTVRLLRSKGIGAGTRVSELLPTIARRGYTNAAKCLIKFGADVNVDNGAPLRNASRAGQRDMVELLVAENANVNVCGNNIEGWTPLSLAVQVDRPDIAACLITAGADVDADGWTPLMEAPYTCKGTEMVGLLIKAGAEVNKRTDTGWTALHSAAEKREDIATLLLHAGANPNVRSHGHGGRTPLHEAAWFGPNVIKVLVDNGADINARDNQGYMPLHFAFYYSLRDSVEQLVALGADINARTTNGETVLHLAATARKNINESASFIEFLLTNGANLDARDNFGWTPLHRAALLGESEVVRVLLAHGADTGSRTNEDKTPLDLARENGHTEIVELLKKHGAKE